jgi:hypothetical protein
MRWVTCIAAPILLADVGDHRFGVFSLDLKRGVERIFGVHGDVVRLPFQFKPDGKLHRHASSSVYFGADVRRCPALVCQMVANKVCHAVITASVFKIESTLRVGPESSSIQTKLSERETN